MTGMPHLTDDVRASAPRDAAAAPGPALADLRARLAECTRRDTVDLYGAVPERWVAYAVDFFWDEAQADPRLAELAALGFQPGQARVLDLAAGCGQFLLRALERGYDCVGIEPEKWKLAFVRDKLAATGRPAEWGARLVDGVGERMPFPDDSFDLVTSYQTMEHVQDMASVVREMLRVTRPGGAIHIRCPDYRSTFEGHYKLPWVPLFPRPLAKAYLRAAGRPTTGLDTLNYTTPGALERLFTRAERATGARLDVVDMDASLFAQALRRRGLPRVPGAHAAYRLAWHVAHAFRAEGNTHVFVRVRSK